MVKARIVARSIHQILLQGAIYQELISVRLPHRAHALHPSLPQRLCRICAACVCDVCVCLVESVERAVWKFGGVAHDKVRRHHAFSVREHDLLPLLQQQPLRLLTRLRFLLADDLIVGNLLLLLLLALAAAVDEKLALLLFLLLMLLIIAAASAAAELLHDARSDELLHGREPIVADFGHDRLQIFPRLLLDGLSERNCSPCCFFRLLRIRRRELAERCKAPHLPGAHHHHRLRVARTRATWRWARALLLRRMRCGGGVRRRGGEARARDGIALQQQRISNMGHLILRRIARGIEPLHRRLVDLGRGAERRRRHRQSLGLALGLFDCLLARHRHVQPRERFLYGLPLIRRAFRLTERSFSTELAFPSRHARAAWRGCCCCCCCARALAGCSGAVASPLFRGA